MKTSDTSSDELCAVRLYFPAGTRAKVTRLWHHLTSPALAQHLLAEAKRDNIKQALYMHVASGYLEGQRMGHFHVEGAASQYPQCLELMDTEQRLRQFLERHKAQLEKVRTVLFRCEHPLQATHDNADGAKMPPPVIHGR